MSPPEILFYWKQKIQDANRTLESDGFFSLCMESTGFIYRKTLRKILPTTGYYTRAGIAYRARKPLDTIVPAIDYKSYPDHEYALVQELRTHVKQGDRVVVIGTGSGTTSIISANEATQSGKIISFEAVSHRVQEARRAISFNNVEQWCDVKHAIVGPVVHLPAIEGEDPQPEQISPKDLPNCDVLELDCEGAEKEILEKFEIKPNVIIVETHPELGTGPEKIEKILKEQAYQIVNRIDRASAPVLTAVYKYSNTESKNN